MHWIREKFGTTVIVGVIGLIGFVFVVSGVFSPKATRGLHEGAVAGTVNGESITLPEYNRELNRRMEFFKNMAGGSISEEQLKAFRLREAVFQDLVRRKLLVQEAYRQGRVASDEEVRNAITEIPAFQKNGKFDVTLYRQTLAQNNLTPGGFERLVREDLSAQQWDDYFRRRVQVSEEEIKRQFLASRDKRTVKYVLLTPETGRKAIQVSEADIQKFLADPAKANLAKTQFEGRKETEYKGKTFDAVKSSIARDILAGEKMEEIRKVNEKLAEQVQAVMTSDKSSDAKVNAILKPYGLEVKSTGPISRLNSFVPGVGQLPELMADAFASPSPIEGKAKKYNQSASLVVAVVTEAQKPDLAKLDTERDDVVRQISMRKQRELYDAWMKNVLSRAKIDPNPSVVSSEES